MFRNYLLNRLCLQKVNLKKFLSRGSRFKIYFCLECRGNRGSSQNFHEIPFYKDRTLISSDHSVTYYSTISCLFKKKQTICIKTQRQKCRYEHWLIRTNMWSTITNGACIRLSFFAIFYVDSIKQNTLENNEQMDAKGKTGKIKRMRQRKPNK